MKDTLFLLGAATAAHQVEGNNRFSDFWAMEHMKYTSFEEPSLDVVDHYHRYKEDIDLLAAAGLNAYRFSIEWARIEPEQGVFSEEEIRHYMDVITYCRERNVEPIVTMHHFSSPKWLIEQGGWETEDTVQAFAQYCSYVVSKLGKDMRYVCTINEANMGLQLAALMRDMMKQLQADIQVGVNAEQPKGMQAMKEQMAELKELFGTTEAHTFLSMRTETGDALIMRAHEAARDAMKEICPHLQIGITLSLFDYQVQKGGEEFAAKEWEQEFLHYLPYLQKDDFFGLQNYTRRIVTADGVSNVPDGAERTQMDYEFYPESVGNVIRKVYDALPKPIIVTENGIATADDSRRIAFIKGAIESVKSCIADNIPVHGYMYWSLLDNFEWQKGFGMKFGLIEVDRSTQKRYPKKSLAYLGTYNN